MGNADYVGFFGDDPDDPDDEPADVSARQQPANETTVAERGSDQDLANKYRSLKYMCWSTADLFEETYEPFNKEITAWHAGTAVNGAESEEAMQVRHLRRLMLLTHNIIDREKQLEDVRAQMIAPGMLDFNEEDTSRFRDCPEDGNFYNSGSLDGGPAMQEDARRDERVQKWLNGLHEPKDMESTEGQAPSCSDAGSVLIGDSQCH